MPEVLSQSAPAIRVGNSAGTPLLRSPMRDRDVREAVRRRLHSQYGSDPHSRIVEEMGVWSGSVRIDLAVINGELHGFELKSDRDTLERLPFQADLYSRVFDRVELIVGARHAAKVTRIAPPWWAISVATITDGVVLLRPMIGYPGDKNPNPEPYLVAQLLWKDEAIAVLDVYGLAKGYRSKNVRLLHERLASCVPFDALARHVRDALKRRPADWLGKQSAGQFNVPIDAKLNPML